MIPAHDTLDAPALRSLLDAGRALVGDLDLDTVLDRLLTVAADVTGARYAALGILDPRRERPERFVTYGVGEEVHRAIGAPPLGVPILIHDEAWGNLYLTDKRDGEPFTQADEDAVVLLASWAAVAIANARAYQETERRGTQLARAMRRLEASTAIALAVGSETDLRRVLELIVARGRDLVGARGVAILLRDDAGLVVAAEAGELPDSVHGARVSGSVPRVRASLALPAAQGLLVPLTFRGRSLGMLAAYGPQAGGEDERLLRAFAASAAIAVANARSVEERRLHEVLRAAEAERTRWAGELHDGTLQSLGALRMLLVAARRGSDADRLGSVVDGAIESLEAEIDALRGLVRELRPASLDELGLGPAIEGLAARVARSEGIEVRVDVDLRRARLHADAETALYRIVQEALSNAVRHAAARHVSIAVDEHDGAIHVDLSDDGQGFDLDTPASGFGLAGIRERVARLHGELEIDSSAAGTHLAAVVPSVRA